jgi:hypothetical protein
MACELKGQGFRGLLDMFRKRFGSAEMAALGAALPGDLGQLVRSDGLVSAGWYPLSWYAEIHTAIEALRPGTARELGKAAAHEDVNTVFKFVLSLASPRRLASLGGRIFATFLRGAVVKVEPVDTHKVHITFDGCDGANRGVWADIEGSIEAFVELSGAKGCKVTRTEPAPGTAVFEVTWS